MPEPIEEESRSLFLSSIARNTIPPDHAGSILARNAILNMAGHGAPLLVALFAIPVLINVLGTERFGMLTIAWIVLGYFSLFDLGLSRAMTQLVSERLGGDREHEVRPMVWTTIALSLALGLLGGVISWMLSPWLVFDVLSMADEGQRSDALRAFYALAVSVPVVVSTASLRGILEARQRFGIINGIRIPLGVFTFAGPLLVLPFSTSLFAIVVILVAGRGVAWAAHFYFAIRAIPGDGMMPALDRYLVGPLLRHGGWFTVSNLISPLMVYMDRFVIGALISVAAVAYYATPWEVVTKLLLIPTALSAVLFPAFGYWYGRDSFRTAELYYRGIRIIVILLFPLALAAVIFARPGLTLWLGASFAEASYRPMQLLTIGVVLNGVAAMPFALLQGSGRPRTTALLHLLEIPIYCGMLWFMLRSWGVAGAALAWLTRVLLDLVMLLIASRRYLPAPYLGEKQALTAVVPAIGLLALAMVPHTLTAQALLFTLFIGAYGILAWRHLLSQQEKEFVRMNLNRAVRWSWARS